VLSITNSSMKFYLIISCVGKLLLYIKKNDIVILEVGYRPIPGSITALKLKTIYKTLFINLNFLIKTFI